MKIYYFTLLLLLLTCQSDKQNIDYFELFKKSDLVFNKNKGIAQDNGLVELSTENVGYFQKFLFIKSANYPNEIIRTNANELYLIYQKYYKNKFQNYSEFLYNVLNFKIIIPTSIIDKDNIVHLDINVMAEYYQNGIKYILKKYTYNEKEKIFLKENLNSKKVITIIYVLYINAYQYHSNDINAQQWFTKQNSLKYILYDY